MKIGYVVQRTYPAELTGSEKFLHEVAAKIAQRAPVRILATRDHRPPPNGTSTGTAPVVETFPALPTKRLGYPARFLLDRADSPALRNVVSGVGDGMVYSMMYGYFSLGLRERLRRLDAEVLHTVAVPSATAWVAWKVAKARGTPFVINPFVHLSSSEQSVPFVLRLVREASAVLAATAAEADALRAQGVSADRLRVIPPGFDLEGTPFGDRGGARRSLGIAEDDFVVMVPRKAEGKGTFHTLRALDGLAGTSPATTVLVLGTAARPLQLAVDAAARRLRRLGLRVLDLGYLPSSRYLDVLAASDVVAEPSQVDSFGLVYLDAWFQRVPVIAARSSSIGEIVADGTTGLLVEFGNVEAIRGALLRLRADPPWRAEMGSRGRDEVHRKYDLNTVADRVWQVYESVT